MAHPASRNDYSLSITVGFRGPEEAPFARLTFTTWVGNSCIGEMSHDVEGIMLTDVEEAIISDLTVHMLHDILGRSFVLSARHDPF